MERTADECAVSTVRLMSAERLHFTKTGFRESERGEILLIEKKARH